MTAPALGPGVRVWVGWCPDDRAHGDGDARLKTGTVDTGPVEPDVYVMPGYGLVTIDKRGWYVDIDDGQRALVAEDDLYPMDGGDEREDIHEHGNETTA